MRSSILSVANRLAMLQSPATTPAYLYATSRLYASGGGPNYFPGLVRRKQQHQTRQPPAAASPSTTTTRRTSLTEADALAARRWAFHRTSMSDPSASRPSLTATVHVVEGGPAVATPGYLPLRSSIADPDWVASVPDHRPPS